MFRLMKIFTFFKKKQRERRGRGRGRARVGGDQRLSTHSYRFRVLKVGVGGWVRLSVYFGLKREGYVWSVFWRAGRRHVDEYVGTIDRPTLGCLKRTVVAEF